MFGAGKIVARGRPSAPARVTPEQTCGVSSMVDRAIAAVAKVEAEVREPAAEEIAVLEVNDSFDDPLAHSATVDDSRHGYP